MRTHKCLTKPRYRSRGFSMVEMMVALVITLILLAGIGQIFLSSKKSFVIQNTLGRIQENGRYAMDVLVSDLRRAGYWGGNSDINSIIGSSGINNATTEACATGGESNWARMLGSSIYGLDLSGSEKPSDTGNDYSCIKNAGATPYVRGDVLMVRYAHASAIGSITKPLPCNQPAPNTTIKDCYPNEYFLRSSLFSGRLFKGVDSEDTSNDLDAPALRTAELVAHAYYIGTSSNASACPADGAVPSLYRVSLVNGVFTVEEIAYGVDNLQVKYGVGVDTNNDDIDDSYRYYDADEIDSTDAAKPDWEDVVTARIWLLVRAECPETGYTNDNTYTMGYNTITEGYTPVDTANRGYRRKLYTSTVKLRNRN